MRQFLAALRRARRRSPSICSATTCCGAPMRSASDAEQLPTFDLANARYVISFGADFLGTWNSPVSHGRAYGDMRQGRRGVRGWFMQVESRMSQTGANADEWVPVNARHRRRARARAGAASSSRDKLRPAAGAGRAGALIEGWSGGLPDYAPEAVREDHWCRRARASNGSRASCAERAPAVAIIGGASARADERSLQRARRQRAQRAARQRRAAGRSVLHAAA